MPRQPYEDLLKKMVVSEISTRAKHVAAPLGPAPGTEDVTGQEEVDLWEDRDLSVDVMAEYQKALASGKNDLDAKSWATGLAYKNRPAMVMYSGAHDDERIAYSKKMRRESEKRAGGEP